MLDIEKFPGADLVGADSVAAAVAAETTRTAAAAATYVPFGTVSGDPVWVTSGKSSYIVNPTPDGGWFACQRPCKAATLSTRSSREA